MSLVYGNSMDELNNECCLFITQNINMFYQDELLQLWYYEE